MVVLVILFVLRLFADCGDRLLIFSVRVALICSRFDVCAVLSAVCAENRVNIQFSKLPCLFGRLKIQDHIFPHLQRPLAHHRTVCLLKDIPSQNRYIGPG